MNIHEIIYLSEQEIIGVHEGLVALFSAANDPIEPSGPRDTTLLGSAASRPKTSLGPVDKYNTLEQKAAALFHSLVKNHAFHNGNKRTALVATLAFLQRNGRRLMGEVTDDELFGMVTGVAEDSWPTCGLQPDQIVTELAQWLRSRVAAYQTKISAMRTTDFLARCRQANIRIVDGGSCWKLHGKTTVSFQKSTSELDGSVLKVYLRKLGVTDVESGISPDVFQEGIAEGSDLLQRFRSLLERLGHA